MTARSWLDLAEPGPRGLLVALTVSSLAIGTVLLEQLELSLFVMDAIAAGWLGALALLWGLLRWRTAPRVRALRAGQSARQERHLHQRGLLVGGAIADDRGGIVGLCREDPAFSEPAIVDRVRRLLHAHAAGDPRAASWIRATDIPTGALTVGDLSLVSVRRDPKRTTLILAALARHDGDPVGLRVTLRRPLEARSLPPDALATLDAPPTSNDWHLTACEITPVVAQPIPAPSSTLDADMRALLAREPDVDPDALTQRAWLVAQAIREEDADTLDALCVPGLGAVVAAMGSELQDGLKSVTAEDIVWTGAGFDGWFELAELRGGPLGMAFLRPTGAEDAPWLLWRAHQGGVE